MARKPAATTRADKVAALQKQARAQDRRRSSVIWGAMGLVLVLIAGAIVFAVQNRPDLDAVVVYDDLGQTHVTEAVEYEQTPPVGGDHNAAWWNCGIYEEEVPPWHAVHSLEHGAIWLTYQPDLPAEQLETLRGLADQEFMLLSPVADQASPVVATAWGKQLSVDTADDDRLPRFIREYRQGPDTPELGAACTGGTTTDLVAAP